MNDVKYYRHACASHSTSPLSERAGSFDRCSRQVTPLAKYSASSLKNRTFVFCDYFVILSHRMKSMDAVEAILGVHVDTSYINMCAKF